LESIVLITDLPGLLANQYVHETLINKAATVYRQANHGPCCPPQIPAKVKSGATGRTNAGRIAIEQKSQNPFVSTNFSKRVHPFESIFTPSSPKIPRKEK